ncbi:hypothetical protein, partial [Pseudomonas aeruginosa]|uniref:hypothetical protein n=1 Tax=Pseudomonas aeruginosa TaxID=287 RepID=UPI001EE73E5E
MNVVLFEFENSLVDCAVIDQPDSPGFFNFEGLPGRYRFARPRGNRPSSACGKAAAEDRGSWTGAAGGFSETNIHGAERRR